MIRTFFIFFTLFFSLETVKSQQLKLQVEGKDTTETKILHSLAFNVWHEDYNSLKKETEEILFELQKKGFLAAKMNNLKRESDSIFSAVYHLQQQISHITLIYALNKEERQLIAEISSKETDSTFTIPIKRLEKVLEQLVFLRSKKGEAFTSMKLEDINNEDSRLIARIETEKSAKREIDKIIIKGYEKFPKAFLEHYLNIKEGQTFNKEQLVKRAAKLKNIAFVSQIKPPEVLFTKDSTFTYLYLKKKNNNVFNGFLGFSNSEENKLSFTGNINLQLQNNLNYGEELSIIYKNEINDQVDFHLGLELPFLFKTPVGLAGELNIFKKDSTYILVEQNLNLEYVVNANYEFSVGYARHTSSNLLDAELINNSEIQDYDAQFFSFGGSYQDIDYQYELFPVQTFISLNAKIGRRATSTTIGQQTIDFFASHSFFISKRSTFYLNNTTNFLNSKSYLQNELFRFGGLNTIRGYLENNFSANFFTTFQSELRYLLSADLYFHSILDFAFFENEILQQKQKLWGYGLGLGFNTKAGLLKLNIANGSSNTEGFSFSKTKVHLGLIINF